MTDHDPLDPLDELASAHLDGLTTAEEAARVDADPELQQRVAAMQAVRDAVRSAHPAAIDEASRARAIAAALAAAEGDELASARARRMASGRTRRALGIAAALVLVALAVPLLASLGGSEDEDLATAGDTSEAASAGGDEAGEALDVLRDGADDDAGATEEDQAASAPDAAMGGGSTGPAEVALGELADLDELEEAVRALLDPTSGSPAAGTGDGRTFSGEAGCSRDDDTESARGQAVVLVGRGVVDGRDVTVEVVEGAAGDRTMRVLAPPPSCELVAQRSL